MSNCDQINWRDKAFFGTEAEELAGNLAYCMINSPNGK